MFHLAILKVKLEANKKGGNPLFAIIMKAVNAHYFALSSGLHCIVGLRYCFSEKCFISFLSLLKFERIMLTPSTWAIFYEAREQIMSYYENGNTFYLDIPGIEIFTNTQNNSIVLKSSTDYQTVTLKVHHCIHLFKLGPIIHQHFQKLKIKEEFLNIEFSEITRLIASRILEDRLKVITEMNAVDNFIAVLYDVNSSMYIHKKIEEFKFTEASPLMVECITIYYNIFKETVTSLFQTI